MLLGFCPYKYTIDYNDKEVMYGEEMNNYPFL